MATTTIGEHYGATRVRIDELLRTASGDTWRAPVAACPGWRVHDVVAHLLGVIEDAAAGRLSGPPSPGVTAAEVERHLDDDPVAMLDRWAALAPPFEARITEHTVWPALLDVVSHEHDIRTAIDRPGARAIDTVILGAKVLVGSMALPVVVHVDTSSGRLSSVGDAGPDALTVALEPWEVLRFRLGRRSRAQVERYDWSAAPDAVIDRLFVFGPADTDLVEG
jgi:uncharacterized protein (TIGR03083 family)